MAARIALIHATPLAIAPINEAFARLWPEVSLMNVLDDSLSADRAKQIDLPIEQDTAMTDRFVRLATYARDTGADAVLYTCSAFGPCIEAANDALDLPVLKPNEAMFRDALKAGSQIGMLATFEPSITPMRFEFEEISQGKVGALQTVCVPEAMAALSAGDGAQHDALLAEASETLAESDALLLAQFSTARARDAVAQATGKPVLTSPDSAVHALMALLA